jgi:hypothetical protein
MKFFGTHSNADRTTMAWSGPDRQIPPQFDARAANDWRRLGFPVIAPKEGHTDARRLARLAGGHGTRAVE